MEHYRFTLDTTFLAQWYPTLRSSALFMSEFMTSYGPYRVTNPTISPENRYYVNGTNGSTAAITMGPAMDTEMLWELFNELKEINSLLKLGDDAFIEETQAIKALLPPLKINYFGGLQEWIEDFNESMPGIGTFSLLTHPQPSSPSQTPSNTSRPPFPNLGSLPRHPANLLLEPHPLRRSPHHSPPPPRQRRCLRRLVLRLVHEPRGALLRRSQSRALLLPAHVQRHPLELDE